MPLGPDLDTADVLVGTEGGHACKGNETEDGIELDAGVLWPSFIDHSIDNEY